MNETQPRALYVPHTRVNSENMFKLISSNCYCFHNRTGYKFHLSNFIWYKRQGGLTMRQFINITTRMICLILPPERPSDYLDQHLHVPLSVLHALMAELVIIYDCFFFHL